MILSDAQIYGLIRSGIVVMEPYHHEQINPASYDITLDSRLLLVPARRAEIDLGQVDDYTTEVEMPGSGYVLGPGEFLLACSRERVKLPADITARIEGKSSLGRTGLVVHVTAGYIDPGFEGQITLEIVNISPNRIRLRPGARIAQLAFHRMEKPAAKPYGTNGVGHYQGQTGPVPSRYRMERL